MAFGEALRHVSEAPTNPGPDGAVRDFDIPTRTRSALITVMADNYAELLNHVFERPPAA